MPIINFKCKKCQNVFDCETGKIIFPTILRKCLKFEKDINCPNCGILKCKNLELTELGQSQVTELFLSN